MGPLKRPPTAGAAQTPLGVLRQVSRTLPRAASRA